MEHVVELGHAYHSSTIATACFACVSASMNNFCARHSSSSHACHCSSGSRWNEEIFDGFSGDMQGSAERRTELTLEATKGMI